jgi:hypothetical protein
VMSSTFTLTKLVSYLLHRSCRSNLPAHNNAVSNKAPRCTIARGPHTHTHIGHSLTGDGARNNHWVIDSTSPSTTTLQDLDGGDGVCHVYGITRTSTTADDPPSGSWLLNCNQAWCVTRCIRFALRVPYTFPSTKPNGSAAHRTEPQVISFGLVRSVPQKQP